MKYKSYGCYNFLRLFSITLIVLLLLPDFTSGQALPTEKQLFPYSVDDRHLTIWNGEYYSPLFIKGMNLGVAVPGTFPGELKATRDDYAR